jgi:hypothetical protein
MPAIKDLTILPQGGHGRTPVVAVARAKGLIEGTMSKIQILATLDHSGKIILWDGFTGKQVVELPMTSWDTKGAAGSNLVLDAWNKSPEVLAESRALLDNFTIKKINLIQIKAKQLLIKGNKLYAYGRNALFIYNLSTLSVKKPVPELIRLFGHFRELKTKVNFLGNIMEKTIGSWWFDICPKGALSSSGQLYLCIYEDEFKVKYFKIYDLQDPKLKPLDLREEQLKFPINSIQDFACNDAKDPNEILVITEAEGRWELHFFELRGDQLKKIQTSPISKNYCFCPTSTFFACIIEKDGIHELRIFDRVQRMWLTATSPKSRGDVYGLKIGLGNQGEIRGMLSCSKGLYKFFLVDEGLKTIQLFGESFQRFAGHLLHFQPKRDEVVLGPSVISQDAKKTFQAKGGVLQVIEFAEKGMIMKTNFNSYRPKIRKVALTNAYFKDNFGFRSIGNGQNAAQEDLTAENQNEAPVSLKSLNMLMDNNLMCSMLLGGSFRTKNYLIHQKQFQDIEFNAQRYMFGILPVREIKGEPAVRNYFRVISGRRNLLLKSKSDQVQHQILKFSPDGNWMATCKIDSNGTPAIDIFDTSRWLKEERADWNIPFRSLSVPIVIKGSNKKVNVKFVDISFHPLKQWIVIGQLSGPRMTNITIYSWEHEQKRMLFHELIWLPFSEEFKVEFSATGDHLIFRTPGKSKVYKITEEEELTLENIFRDEAEEKSIQQENKLNEKSAEEEKKVFDFLAFGQLENIFESSCNCPQLIAKDTQIVLERKDISQLEIWDILALQEQLKLHGNQRSEFEETPDKVVKINTAQIPYTSFQIFEEKSIIIFYTEGADCIRVLDWTKDTEAPVATIFPFGREGFLMVDANNNYLTNARGHEFAAFKLNEELFPMEQFDLMLNRPDLVLSSLKGLSSEVWIKAYKAVIRKRVLKILEDRLRQTLDLPKEAEDLLLKNMADSFEKRILSRSEDPKRREQFLHLPHIEIEEFESHTSKNSICLTATLQSKGMEDRPTRLNVYLNNVPIYGKEGVPLHWGKLATLMDDTRLELKKNSNKLDVELKKIESTEGLTGDSIEFKFGIHLKLATGLNKIQVSILNIDGIEYYQTHYANRHFDKKRPSPPNVYFVGIAVGEHDEKNDLNFLEGGMENLISAIKEVRKTSVSKVAERNNKMKIGRLNTFTLPAKDKNGLTLVAPTRENILKFLRETKETLRKKVRVDDKVIFYYGGHGVRDTRKDWGLVLSGKDMGARDEAGVKIPGIAYEEFELFMDGLNSANKLMVIDACASGEIDAFSVGQVDQFDLNSIDEIDGINKLFNLMKGTFSDLRRGTGTTVLAAALGDEVAIDGIFVEKFTEAIQKYPKIYAAVDYMIKMLPRELIEEMLDEAFGEDRFKTLKALLRDEFLEIKSTEFSTQVLTLKLNEVIEEKIAEAMDILSEAAEKQVLEEFLEKKDEFIDKIIRRVPQPTLRSENRTVDWKIWQPR